MRTRVPLWVFAGSDNPDGPALAVYAWRSDDAANKREKPPRAPSFYNTIVHTNPSPEAKAYK